MVVLDRWKFWANNAMWGGFGLLVGYCLAIKRLDLIALLIVAEISIQFSWRP